MSILLPSLLWFGSGGQFVFGAAKPVPVNPGNYRNYRRGDIIVSSAGVVANMLLFVACMVLFASVGLVGTGAGFLGELLVVTQRMLFWGVWLNVLLAFFNLFPIPPLDGSHLLYHALPSTVGARYRELSRYGFLLLLALMFFLPGVFLTLLSPAFWLVESAFSLMAPFALQQTPF
jgi:Zn-dependent protease